MGASCARIYPTIVFKDTELSDWLNLHEYEPLSVDVAVERCASVLSVFIENKVSCIRIGLCDSENLHSDSTYIAGPNSPALGEMVKSRVYLLKLFSLLEEFPSNNDFLTIICPKGAVSQIVGQKKVNIAKLKERFGLRKVEIIEDAQLSAFEVKIKRKGGNTCD
jgi:histone acetyltransferase (RNA polymerase elongator complex component)